jgi:hypothetical protein
MGDDSTYTPHVIPTGGTLFEPANMVHIVRNEGDVPLVNVVVQLVPTAPSEQLAHEWTAASSGRPFARSRGAIRIAGQPRTSVSVARGAHPLSLRRRPQGLGSICKFSTVQ